MRNNAGAHLAPPWPTLPYPLTPCHNLSYSAVLSHTLCHAQPYTVHTLLNTLPYPVIQGAVQECT